MSTAMTIKVTPHAKLQLFTVNIFRQNTGALNANVLSVVIRPIIQEEKASAVCVPNEPSCPTENVYHIHTLVFI